MRRNSIAGFPIPGTSTQEPTPEEPNSEDTFYDANEGEMPGSGKKKKHGGGMDSDPMEQDTPGSQGVDPAMLELLMSIKKDINDTTNEAVGRVNTRIDENAKAIEKIGENTAEEIKKLRQHVEESQSRFEERMTAQFEMRSVDINRRLASLEAKRPAPETSGRPDTGSPKRQDAYNKARKTLKIWPIAGPDLEDSVKVFMKTKLGIEDDRIAAFGQIQTKYAAGKAAKDRSEVLAVFDNREDRDYVKSLGFNLAKEKNVGMSIHVPGHLLDNYYALNSLGYNIRQMQEGVKRSVKFDDAVHDIYLDICIGGNWKRILPNEARAALKASPGAGNVSTSRGISAEDLASLIRGESVPGLTSVVVPEDPEDNNTRNQ